MGTRKKNDAHLVPILEMEKSMSVGTDRTMRTFTNELKETLNSLEMVINSQEKNIAVLSSMLDCKLVMRDDIVKRIVNPSAFVVEKSLMVSHKLEQFTHEILGCNISTFEASCLAVLAVNKALREQVKRFESKTRELYQRMDDCERLYLDELIDFLDSKTESTMLNIDFRAWDGLPAETDLLEALHRLFSEGNKLFLKLEEWLKITQIDYFEPEFRKLW